MDFTDQITLFTIASWVTIALVTLVGLIVTYWVIRLAVAHALRSHHYWLLEENGR